MDFCWCDVLVGYMILTQEERSKFCCYLEQQIHDTSILLEQLKPRGPGFTNILATQMRTEMMAEKIVLGKLRSFSTETIK